MIILILIFIESKKISATEGQIVCEVCHELRNYLKYKRHLNHHVRQGKISIYEMKKILFQSRYTRQNIKNRSFLKNRLGSVCQIEINGLECKAHILDLSYHPRRIHCLSTTDVLFLDAINHSQHCERVVIFKNFGMPKSNSLKSCKNITKQLDDVTLPIDCTFSSDNSQGILENSDYKST